MATPSLRSDGFQVSVMPQVQAVDPRLYASDPSQISQGALQAFQVMGALQNLKDARAQAAEREATQQARIDQIKALSNLQVLASDRAAQTQAPTIANDLATLGLGTAKATGELATLPETQALGKKQRTLANMQVDDSITNFERNLEVERANKKSETLRNKAQAAEYFANAERYRAEAEAKGVPIDKATEAFHRQVGELAATVGKTPTDVQELYNSGVVNQATGLTLAAELAQYAENVKKHEFFIDPAAALSPELKQWIGGVGIARLQRAQELDGKGLQFSKGGPVVIPTNEATATPDSGEAPAGGNSAPAHFKIDASGNVTVPGAKEKEAPKEQPQASTGSSVGNAAETAGILSLAALANPALRARLTSAGEAAGKLATRLWNGRSAAGTFTGKALKTLPKRSLNAFTSGGVGSVAGPVSALYAANQGLGSLLSDKDTGDLTAIEAISKAATQPSFDEQARTAKYDELSSRIHSIAQSTNLSDEQKAQELHKLINQRDLLWSMMQQD